MSKWAEYWQSSKEYEILKLSSFNAVDNYLKTSPKNILDIGCGFAFESRLFYKKYKSNLWLLDGDVSTNKDCFREIKFGSVESMGFYNKLDDIRNVCEFDKIENYQMIDANKIEIPLDQKFDLICSYLSCGFHYPISSYKELIKKHSHKDTELIFDLRRKNLEENEVKILKIIEEGEKHIKAVIKL